MGMYGGCIHGLLCSARTVIRWIKASAAARDPLGGAVDGGDDMGTVAAELAAMKSDDPGGCYVHLLPSDSAGWAAVLMVSMRAAHAYNYHA